MKLFSYSGKYCKVNKESHGNTGVTRFQKKSTSLKIFRWLPVIVVCAVGLVASVCLLLHSCGNSVDVPDLDATLPSVEQTAPSEQATTVPTETTKQEETTVPTEVTEPAETEPAVKEIMPKFQDLYDRNQEFYGWLTLGGTNIDYPVMHSPDDNNKYLHANFDGDYSYAGIPYVDMKCSLDSDNLLVYGHNMNDGSMFNTLLRYEQESFWEEHPTFTFSDLYQDYEYEVLSVFRDRIYKKTDTCFKFYQFIDAADEEAFDYAISQLKEKSIYDTGVDAEYGDKLITLITCAYHVDNGRFVVVARRK